MQEATASDAKPAAPATPPCLFHCSHGAAPLLQDYRLPAYVRQEDEALGAVALPQFLRHLHPARVAGRP